MATHTLVLFVNGMFMQHGVRHIIHVCRGIFGGNQFTQYFACFFCFFSGISPIRFFQFFEGRLKMLMLQAEQDPFFHPFGSFVLVQGESLWFFAFLCLFFAGGCGGGGRGGGRGGGGGGR